MAGTQPSYHCATEPKDHRGVAAYWATTPIRVDMVGTIGPYTISQEKIQVIINLRFLETLRDLKIFLRLIE